MQIVFIGPPGAGKGTQCQLLIDYIRAAHISTGQLLRDEITADTAEGQAAASYLKQGQLAPDDLVLGILRKRLERIEPEHGLLFDGFPRTVNQADGLDETLREYSRPLDVALELIVPDEEIIRRLAGRGRADDTQETIRTRLNVYWTQTAPVLDYYRQRRKLREIDGLGSTEEVFARIRACVDACQQKAG